MSSNRKKNLDFEINLLPVISLLAVLISFLLLSTVWVHLGSMDISQSFGSSAKNKDSKAKVLNINFSANGRLDLQLVNSKGRQIKLMRNLQVKKIERSLERFLPKGTSIQSAIVKPHARTSFESIVSAMDQIKKNKILDIGVAPL